MKYVLYPWQTGSDPAAGSLSQVANVRYVNLVMRQRGRSGRSWRRTTCREVGRSVDRSIGSIASVKRRSDDGRRCALAAHVPGMELEIATNRYGRRTDVRRQGLEPAEGMASRGRSNQSWLRVPAPERRAGRRAKPTPDPSPLNLINSHDFAWPSDGPFRACSSTLVLRAEAPLRLETSTSRRRTTRRSAPAPAHQQEDEEEEEEEVELVPAPPCHVCHLVVPSSPAAIRQPWTVLGSHPTSHRIPMRGTQPAIPE